MKKLAIVQVILLGASLLIQPMGVPGSEVPADLSVRTTCIDEPVFGQRACIYEANREAKQTVVLVHGLNGQALRDWARQIQPLARHYHVLSFDLPGFGASDKGPDYYSPSAYARFIRYITKRYAKRPFHLIGHSMGGAIVLRYTADNPEDIERLVLVDVAGVLHRTAYARMLATAWATEHMVSDERFGGFLDRMVNKFITKAEGIAGLGNEYLARKLIEHELIEAQPQVVAAFTLANEDLSDALLRIRGPVLLLWGEEDKIAPLRTAKVLKARLPQAKLITFAGAGHSLMSEAAAPFNRELLAFLSAAQAKPRRAGPAQAEAEAQQRLALQGERQIECRRQRDMVYEGHFEWIVLDGCSGVVIRDATIGSLQAVSSTVKIENSQIGQTAGIGLTALGSDLTVTASEIRGRIAVHASRSRLDLAGVRLVAGETAVSGDRGSSLIFSVSELHMHGRSETIHGYFEVDRNNFITNNLP